MDRYEYITHSASSIFTVFKDSRTKDYFISNEYGERYWLGEMIDLIELKETLDCAIRENQAEIRRLAI